MSHPSYAKGHRFEKKVQAWLVHLGKCTRSFMSRGADLTLLYSLREWKVSCKCRAKSISKLIDDELENNDVVVHGCDRGIPIVSMHLPKFVEFTLSEAGTSDAFIDQVYAPNGTEG